MHAALEGMDMPEGVRSAMVEYFENAATHLINRTHPPLDTGGPRSRSDIPLR